MKLIIGNNYEFVTTLSDLFFCNAGDMQDKKLHFLDMP